METNIRLIRETLGLACETQGYFVYDTMPQSPSLPCVVISWPEDVTYNRTLKGAATITFSVLVAVPDNDFAGAQKRIDDVLSVPGLPAQIQGYEAATPAWMALQVRTASNIRREQAENNATYLLAELTVIVNPTAN